MRINSFGLVLLFAILLTACGKKESNSASAPSVAVQKQEQSPEGVYRVVLSSSDSTTQKATGAGTIKIDEQKIEINLKMLDMPKRTKLYQFINTAGDCPKMEHDLNQDGTIDFHEAKEVAGEILIPLDSDLGTQTSGIDDMPVSNSQGYYSYEEEAVWEEFMRDLRAPSDDTPDHMKKLSAVENLNLAGKSLLILTIPTGTNELIPQTATTIACGKIVKIPIED